MKSIALLLVAVCVVAAVAETKQAPNRSKLSLFPAAGFEPSAYDELSNAIQASVATSNASICVAHSTEGAARLAVDAVSSQCTRGHEVTSRGNPDDFAELGFGRDGPWSDVEVQAVASKATMTAVTAQNSTVCCGQGECGEGAEELQA